MTLSGIRVTLNTEWCMALCDDSGVVYEQLNGCFIP